MPHIPPAAREPYGKPSGARKRPDPAPRVASPPLDAPKARAPPGRIYVLRDLREKGIKYSPVHIRRLVRKGLFPAPIYLSPRCPAWTESMLDEWLAGLSNKPRKR